MQQIVCRWKQNDGYMLGRGRNQYATLCHMKTKCHIAAAHVNKKGKYYLGFSAASSHQGVGNHGTQELHPHAHMVMIV